MKRLLVVMACWAIVPTCTWATTIFESGTLGPTGILYSELGNSVAGTNVRASAFTGVRFETKLPTRTSDIGGHFVSSIGGDFFGAIVALEDGQDFPDSGDLSTPDVLGHAQLTFPMSSTEVFGDLELELTPGWYALVFGSGLFGASGDGAAVANNPDIGEPAYIGFQSQSGLPWLELGPPFTDHRFIVRGIIVPEPSTLMLILASLCSMRIRHR